MSLMSQSCTIDLSIVIPCYRSAPWLGELVERIIATMRPTLLRFEVILVNDASPDDTWNAIEQAVANHPCVRGFDMLFNVGQFRATMCGLEHAQGEFIMTMDDDLQHPPEEIPKLIDTLRARANVDCVIGAYEQKRHGPFRNLGSGLMARFNEAFYGKPRDLKTSSFRVMRRQVADAICAHRTSKPIINPLLLRSTRRIINVPVEHHPRPNGSSGYSIRRLMSIALDNLINATTLPLKVVSLFGVISAAGSVMLGIHYLIRYVSGGIGVPGFATQVLLITFFGGMTLLSVGLLGEYVIRIIYEVARPPRYCIRQIAEISIKETLPPNSGTRPTPSKGTIHE